MVVAALASSGLYRRGVLRFNHPAVARFPVRGIDVSHHQGTIDWRRVREAGVDFAFIKATEGADAHDGTFARNWAEAGAAGIARGAYHFFTFCSPGAAQARNFLRAIERAAGELPPVVDVELGGNCAHPPDDAQLRGELRAFLDVLGDSRALIYYTRAAYRRLLRPAFEDRACWPRNIWWQPHGRWSFWQFADDGRVDGIRTAVDLDVFAGDRAAFATLLRTRADVGCAGAVTAPR